MSETKTMIVQMYMSNFVGKIVLWDRAFHFLYGVWWGEGGMVDWCIRFSFFHNTYCTHVHTLKY